MERPKNKNRESNGDLGLDGRHRLGGHNNQPIVSISGQGNVEEETRPGWNVWGGTVSSLWPSNSST
jgi:hypothetical protein